LQHTQPITLHIPIKLKHNTHSASAINKLKAKHMKYITLIIGLLVVGCGTPAENATKAKPVKELTPEQKSEHDKLMAGRRAALDEGFGVAPKPIGFFHRLLRLTNDR
jgi:hypothetical protein